MSYEEILYDVSDSIATLTFNLPERSNPMSAVLMDETIAALDEANSSKDVRVVVITGAGRNFSAGGDLRRLGGTRDDAPPTSFDRRAGLKRTQRMILAIRAVEKPVIAAVNGAAAGGGCDIALACDLRFASDRARFGEVFAKIGLFPGTGGTYLLPRTVGIAKALELIWSGDLIDAEEALRIGLVNRVVPHDDLMDETRAFATRLAQGPPLALSLAKAAVYRGLDVDLASALDYAATAESITLSSEDHREGLRAFQERRQAEFQGR